MWIYERITLLNYRWNTLGVDLKVIGITQTKLGTKTTIKIKYFFKEWFQQDLSLLSTIKAMFFLHKTSVELGCNYIIIVKHSCMPLISGYVHITNTSIWHLYMHVMLQYIPKSHRIFRRCKKKGKCALASRSTVIGSSSV